jgi:hypothetical protein
MTLMFHQNMLNYAGGTGAAAAPNAHRTRNQQFDRDFNAIRAVTGEVYVVAGFTELLNRRAAAVGIAARARALDRGLRNCTVIGVGITATGARDEYIGIAWDRGIFTIQNAGQVLFNGVANQWQCYNTQAPGGPPPLFSIIPLPNVGNTFGTGAGRKRKFDTQLVADSRGLAYVHGTWGGQGCIFAFMHNMHSVGDPTSAFSSLDAMVTAVRTAVNDNNAYVYIGGDFNILPRKPGRGALTYAAATYVSAGQTWFRDTTLYHPYDFWLTSTGATNADARVRSQTLYSHISDHAAITLNV